MKGVTRVDEDGLLTSISFLNSNVRLKNYSAIEKNNPLAHQWQKHPSDNVPHCKDHVSMHGVKPNANDSNSLYKYHNASMYTHTFEETLQQSVRSRLGLKIHSLYNKHHPDKVMRPVQKSMQKTCKETEVRVSKQWRCSLENMT